MSRALSSPEHFIELTKLRKSKSPGQSHPAGWGSARRALNPGLPGVMSPLSPHRDDIYNLNPGGRSLSLLQPSALTQGPGPQKAPTARSVLPESPALNLRVSISPSKAVLTMTQPPLAQLSHVSDSNCHSGSLQPIFSALWTESYYFYFVILETEALRVPWPPAHNQKER
jgi:hypothetical protein